MEEKIREEFCKDWDWDNEAEKEEYRKTCVRLLKKTVNNQELSNIEIIEKVKELLEELENEIGE